MASVEVWERDPAGVVRVRADNPSPLTLDGTNTYVVGHWVVDPGPSDPGASVRDPSGRGRGRGRGAHARARGPLRVRGFLRRRRCTRRARGRRRARSGRSPPPVTRRTACASSWAGVCFTGDTVLGTGSVFISPGEGSLGAYLESLRRLRGLDLEVLCPGHGPYVWDPRAKLDEYIDHRLERERMLVAALDAGLRDTRRAARRGVGGCSRAPAPGRRAVASGPPGEAGGGGPAPGGRVGLRDRPARGGGPPRRSLAPRRPPRPPTAPGRAPPPR